MDLGEIKNVPTSHISLQRLPKAFSFRKASRVESYCVVKTNFKLKKFDEFA